MTPNPKTDDLTPDQRIALERVAGFVVRFGMTIPAIMALESMRPLSVVGAQFMYVLSPSVSVFLPTNQWEALAMLLEKRGGLDHLLDAIESAEAQRVNP
ncbi:MAG TPA: hypothetical protein EYN66_09335 [Myxococcales bacterium]|nr:hypothetical protein [Myxococcales bacterium]